MRELALFLGPGLLFTHELDAMPNHESRVLPLIRALPDDVGMSVFVALHVPIFAALVALLASRDRRTRDLARLGVAAFLVVHGVLRAAYVNHPEYEFSSALSRLLVFGGVVAGATYLSLTFKDRNAPRA